MYVVFTSEGVRVLFLIVDTFYLNCSVEQVILSTTQVGDLGESFEWLDRLDVDGHRDLTHGDSPDVEVVNVNNVTSTFREYIFS